MLNVFEVRYKPDYRSFEKSVLQYFSFNTSMTTHLPNSGVVVFSGGSAANSLVDVFNHLVEAKDCPLSYVIPISDNGGSSSELIRVLGGPGTHRISNDLNRSAVG